MPVFRALALLAAAVPLLSASHPALTQDAIPSYEHPEIVRVHCLKTEKKITYLIYGTAFRVSRNILLTAAHVSHNPNCFIGTEKFKEIATAGDFSVLQMDKPDDHWLAVDCAGYVKGRKYRAIGYARGLETQTEIDLEGTGKFEGGQAALTGVYTVIPGQSGGPILDDQTGKVVGVVNTYDMERGLSGSVELKGTSVCKGAA